MDSPWKNQSDTDYTVHLFIFLVALTCRMGFMIWIDEPIVFGKYPFFADKLAAGGDLGERLVDISPFYLYWTALLSAFFSPEWQAAKWIQAFLGALVSLQVLSLGNRAFNRAVGVIAALIYATYGNLIVLETTLEPTVFVLLFNVQAVWFLQTAGRFPAAGLPCRRAILAAGLFTGLSTITKPTFLLFVPVGCLYLLMTSGGASTGRTRLINAVIFAAAAGLVILPVTVRNWVALDDFVLVTADAGKVFFHGNGQGATALQWTGLPDEGFAEEYGSEPDWAHVLFRQTASKLSGRTLSPSESSRFWFKRALADIAADPVAYGKRQWRKFLFFFSDYELHYIASAYKEYRTSVRYPFLRFGIIAALGLAGMVLSAGAWRQRFLIYAGVLLYLASGLMFIVQSRYRMPAVPYLCLFAGFSVWTVRQWLADGRYRAAGMGVCAVMVLFFFSHFALRGDIRAADRWQTATKIHYQLGGRLHFTQGRYRAAVSDLNACIAMAPGFAPAYNLRGRARAILGDTDAALADFERVIALSPNMAAGYKHAGFIYLLEGRREKARALLEAALALSPADAQVAETLSQME